MKTEVEVEVNVAESVSGFSTHSQPRLPYLRAVLSLMFVRVPFAVAMGLFDLIKEWWESDFGNSAGASLRGVFATLGGAGTAFFAFCFAIAHWAYPQNHEWCTCWSRILVGCATFFGVMMTPSIYRIGWAGAVCLRSS